MRGSRLPTQKWMPPRNEYEILSKQTKALFGICLMNSRLLTLALLTSSLLPCAAQEIPSFIPSDFKRASSLQIIGFHAGNVQGVRSVTATYPATSPVFALLAASWPESEVPAGALQTVQHAILVIDEVRYRLTVPLFRRDHARLYFSVAPETAPRQVTYFSLASDKAADLAQYFHPPH